MDKRNQFSAADFAVFGGMLGLSLVIGIYYAYADRKKKSLENYYFGGRHMSPVPVALSLAVTFISSITVLGLPAHAYVYGTVIIWFALAISVQITIACIYYIPLFHRLKLSSVYEYLELRYHRGIRLITSFFVIIFMGGMKAVVWNDAFQSGIMVAGVLALTIKTVLMVGGLEKVWEALSRGKRNTFWTFDPDPTQKHTIWTIMIGSGISWISSMCTNQAITQRYQSLKSVRDARFASIVGAIPMVGLQVLSAITGCAMFAYFETCDPVTSGKLEKIDQTVPYLVVQVFQDAPGMAGLFVAAAYSGMLSTVSSGINSLSALIMEDFIVPLKPSMKNSTRLTISKFLSVLFGILTTVVAFVTQYLGKTIVQVVMTLFGTFGGPILAIYSLGIHFPWINTKGAGIGLIGGVSFSMWAALGAIIYKPKSSGELPFSSEGCPDITQYNSSTVSAVTTLASMKEQLDTRPLIADTLYSLSYMYLALVGLCVSAFLAFTVSFLSGKNDPKKMDPRLFVPLVDNNIFPESVRKFFRFGVAEYVPEIVDDEIDNHPKIAKEKLLIEHQNGKNEETNFQEQYTKYDEHKEPFANNNA